MSDPSSQLQDELHASVRRAIATQRPILTHLNADTTWLLQLPYPEYVRPPAGRSRFNILIDPWLRGPQSDVSSWFSTQWHATESCVQTIAEVNQLLRDVQDVADELQVPPRKRRPRNHSDAGNLPPMIDLVVISHEFTDHCHRETLLEIDQGTPVIATKKAAELISSWKHFTTILDTPPFTYGTDWRTTTVSPLPKWLSVCRAVTESDSLYYHSAILIIFDVDATSSSIKANDEIPAEVIVYTPHGIHAKDLKPLRAAIPSLKTLALLHGLHDVQINFAKQLNLGAHNALQAQRTLDSSYWIGTHDEVKRAGGILAPFLRRKVLTVEEALKKEKEQLPTGGDEVTTVFKDVSFANLGSGESILLEA